VRRLKDPDEVVVLSLTVPDATDLMGALDIALTLMPENLKRGRWSTIQRQIAEQLYTSKERQSDL
jgi:hypothetical protein